MGGLEAAIAQQGGPLIFLNVALQQIGVPLPAEPTLLVAGSLAMRGRVSLPEIAVAVLAATLLVDLLWFFVGRRYGARALRVVFRASSAPEKRLGQLERLLARFGPAAYAFAKFIPGLPMAGPVLAGARGTTLRVFLVYDLLAMAVWSGACTGLGMIFHGNIALIVDGLDRVGGWGLLLAAVVVTILALRAVATCWRRACRTGDLEDERRRGGGTVPSPDDQGRLATGPGADVEGVGLQRQLGEG